MAVFAKRHYEAIAQVMQSTHGVHGWLSICEELADMFHTDNHAFNRARFLNACLPGQNVRSKTAHLETIYANGSTGPEGEALED